MYRMLTYRHASAPALVPRPGTKSLPIWGIDKSAHVVHTVHMIRHTITLPHTDNHGQDITRAHEYVQDALLSTYGGYTTHEVRGQWREEGTTYTDVSTVYTVDTDGTTRGTIARIAAVARDLARQHCVYLTEQEVTTTYI